MKLYEYGIHTRVAYADTGMVRESWFAGNPSIAYIKSYFEKNLKKHRLLITRKSYYNGIVSIDHYEHEGIVVL